jgi:hypothetical protein
MRFGDRTMRLAATWFGGAAMLVQILLPLLLAAEIRLADAGAFPVGAEHVVEATPPGSLHHRHGAAHHHHDGAMACPICQIVAASQAFTSAPVPMLALPRDAVVVALLPSTPRAFAARIAVSFRARAPPNLV